MALDSRPEPQHRKGIERATGAILEAYANAYGVKRSVEADASLRRRALLAMKGAGTQRAMDRIFYALTAALPGCGVVLAENRKALKPPTFWELLLATLRLRPVPKAPPRLIVGVYVPQGIDCSLSDVSDALKASAPAGIAWHIVVHGNVVLG